jgi:hypothetical protein
MTDDFLTKGLENDRYLKALRLAEQFQTEIAALLRQFDQRMVDAHPDLFDPSNTPKVKESESQGSALANHRMNHEFSGPAAPEDRCRLNVHLYWMEPAKYDRTDIDGALRAFGYKLKGADTDIDARVVQETRDGDWNVDIADNPYDSNKVFYRHVSSMEDIENTIDTLVRHFEEFGDRYKR